MKLNLHTKLLFLLGLLINQNIIICAAITSQANKLGFINNKDKNYNKAKFGDNFRFSTSETSELSSAMDRSSVAVQNDEIQNVFTMSTLIESSRPPPSESDQEQEVIPSNAESGTYFSRKFWWFNIEDRNPRNAISQWHGWNYWKSEYRRTDDWWQADFSSVTKFDSMEILWRDPPKEFKVEFNVSDGGTFIPLTENHLKFVSIVNGKTMNRHNVSKTDAIIFQKPVFAKNIRITMKNPLNGSYFAINKVRFYNKRTITMIYNQTFSPCQNFCLYVNTDKPRVNTRIVGMGCLEGMATGDNRELFTFYNDKSLRLYNAQHLCVGKNGQKEIVLVECDEGDPTFKLETRSDSSLYFQSLEDECIYMNTEHNKSDNFVNENTEIIATSEFDKGSFKKENMRINSERYWMSTPGQEVVTLQINYGRIGKKEENNWEIKKIDYIILEFTKAPKDFKILTWYPGSPWTLIKSVINFTETKIEIKLKGVKASSIMIQFEKGHTFPEFSNMVAYAIKQVEVGTYSHRILIDKCDQITKKKGRKEFDFDSQYETKTPHKESYEKVSAEALTTFQSLIKAYKIMKAYKYYVEKAKLTANTLKKRLDDLGNNVIERSMKLMQEFYSKKLLKSTNPEFDTYLERLENKKMDQNSNDSNVSVVGEADSNPGENCYQIKTINRSVLSGFYWIKPDCTPKAIRVFCDFSVFGDAVDIFVTSGEKTESNPDLSEWKIENEKSIGYRCANYGLFPIEIRSPQMLGRIINIVEYLGYDLTMPQVIPLGYDYDCEKKCSKEFKSFSSKDSKPINTYFSEKNENNKSETGTMAGIGFGNINSMKIFDPKKIKITAIVCSTNVFQKDDKEDISQVNCEKTVSGNANEFPSNNNKVILCENGCNMSSAPVYGNGLFDGKSSICKSAIYDGKLTSSGGKIVLSIKEPIKGNEYNTLITGGGQQNGIQSDKNFKNDGSTPFSFEPYDPECPINNYLTDTQKDLNDANSRSSFIESGFNSDNFSLDELSDEQLNKMTLHGKPLKDIANLLEYEPRFNEGIFGKAIDKVKNWFGKKKQELPNVDVKQQVEDAKNAAKKGLDETIRQANKGAEVAKDTMTKMEDSARESAKKLVNTEENPFAPKQNFSTETQKSAAKKLEEQAKKKVEEEEEATDDKPKPKNCSPTTSKGIAVLKSIFKNSDYKKLGKFKENIAQIQKAMDNFSETTAWAEKSSELSNFQLYLLYYKMVRQSNELVSRLRRTVSISDARIQKTDFYKKKWMKRLMKLNRFDKFSPETPKINLKEEFSVKNYKSMDLATPEWKFVTQNIKKRATAFGLVGKYKPKEGMFGSMLIQKTRNLYDAEIKVDILVTSEGITGLVFKFIDRFNFYALVINTQTSDNKNYKAIVKMNQGKLTTLNKIEDGGILINNWHKIKLNTISNSFIIEVQDLENKSPKKTLMATDADFVQGKVGFFSTNTEGVYFDKFSISSHTCWQPWQPRADLEIRTNSVNIYHEEFLGNLETKYDLIEPNNTENGPMKFKLNYVETPGEDAGLNQLKATYDTSQLRKPVMAINKKVMYTSGIYKVGFKGLDAGGAVSIIFKYNVFGAKKAEIFYCFDLIDTIDNTNRYVLRKFENNTAQTLVTVNNLNDNKITSNGFQLGYKQSKKVKVIVNCNRNNIVIKISFDGSDLVKVLDYKDKFPIKSGLVGVGTHATRVNFYSIETTPFVGILTESAVSNYLSSDNERILPGVTSDSGSDDEESNNSGPGEIQSGTWRNAAGGDDKKSKDSKEKSQDKKKDCKEKRKQNDFGAAECSKTRSEIEKFDYCHRKYEDDNARKVCKGDFCNACCIREEKDGPLRANCVKKCEGADTPVKTGISDFDSCHSPTSENNIMIYCDHAFNTESAIRSCKLDHCRLCCTFKRFMTNKKYSRNLEGKCYSKCREKLKPKDRI